MRTSLTESDERTALWKGRILKALEQNGKVLTDVIPELELLIGPQPDVQPLPPMESLHRFHDVFGRFLTCLATKETRLSFSLTTSSFNKLFWAGLLLRFSIPVFFFGITISRTYLKKGWLIILVGIVLLVSGYLLAPISE